MINVQNDASHGETPSDGAKSVQVSSSRRHGLLIVAAIIWVLATSFFGFVTFAGAALSGADWFGVPNPNPERSGPYFFGAGLIVGAGPLGIFLFRRNVLWLTLALIPVALGAIQWWTIAGQG